MIQAIEPLVQLEVNHKVKLSIPLLATYLKRGVNMSEISRICNITPQAVSDYIKRHYDKLSPLVDETGLLQATKAQHVADFAQDRLLLHLRDTDKKDLFALNAISGTHIDKYRLLSDKSTENVSMTSLDTSLDDLNKREQEIMTKLKTSTGVTEDIIDV